MLAALQLAGVLGGPPWSAVLEGVPGRDTPVVVSAGDTVGELRLLAIALDHVVIVSSDSTITLRLKRVWK